MPTMGCEWMTAWQPHRRGRCAGGGGMGECMLLLLVYAAALCLSVVALSISSAGGSGRDVDRSVNLGVTARICQSASPRLDTSAIALARPDQHRWIGRLAPGPLLRSGTYIPCSSSRCSSHSLKQPFTSSHIPTRCAAAEATANSHGNNVTSVPAHPHRPRRRRRSE